MVRKLLTAACAVASVQSVLAVKWPRRKHVGDEDRKLAEERADIAEGSTERRGRRSRRFSRSRSGESAGNPVPAAQDGAGKILSITAYWKLTESNVDQGTLRTGPGGYLRNMPIVMNLNTSMMIYGDEFGLEHMKAARNNSFPDLLAMHEVDYNTFEPCKSHGDELRNHPMKYTHPLHCPSITKGCIWDGKLSLIKEAAKEFPDFDYYAWLDIGMHAYKVNVIKKHVASGDPWPVASKLALLPKDRVSISRTGSWPACKAQGKWPFCHAIAATAMVIPKAIVNEFVEAFYNKMEECLDYFKDKEGGYQCISEQVLLTQMQIDNPKLFHVVGKGYGEIAANMSTTEQLAQGVGQEDLVSWLGSEDGEAITRL